MIVTPDDPYGQYFQLRALVARNGYSNAVVREIEALLRRTYLSVATRFMAAPIGSPTSAEMLAFVQFATERLAEVTGSMKAIARTRVSLLGSLEAEAARNEGNKLLVSMGKQSRSLIVSTARYSEIIDQIEVGGVGFDEWWTDSGKMALRRVKNVVQEGIITGDNPLAIARRIVSAKGRERTVASTHVAQVRTVVRSAMNAVQTQASVDEFRELERDIGEPMRVQFQAILDARTSKICAAVDGKIYLLTDPNLPRPPLHPNCRSALVPYFAGMPARQNYDSWLKAQPDNVQDAVLGTSLAKHWRANDIRLADLIGDDRRPLSLSAVRARYGLAA